VPAGDIGVGGREIGFMFGQWKRLTSLHTGVLTGKGFLWGGSNIRPEATGYGLVYIVDIALQHHKDSIKGKRVAISGKGNVAEYAAVKVLQLGGIVVSLSDSDGSVVEENGFSEEQVNAIRKIEAQRGRIKDYMKTSKTAKFFEKDRPWKHVKCDIALPCATQNEVNKSEAEALVKGGCKYVAEGANMPSDPEAIAVFKKGCKFFIPAKASNAGGVAVSGLEMSQNSQRTQWTREEVDTKLFGIMKTIFENISSTAADLGQAGDYQLGANAAGFKKVADAMFEQGMVV